MIRLLALFIILAIAASSPAAGCSPAPFALAERTRSSEIIFVGYVTGERYAEYETDVLAGEDPEGVPLWGERLVRVVPVERLRGSPAANVEVAADCGLPIPEVFKRVVVFQAPGRSPWVGLASSVEAEVREQLAGGL